MASQTVDLRAEVVNIKVMRNDAWSVKVTITGSDLTGYTVEGQVREDYDSTDFEELVFNVSELDVGIFHYGQDAATINGVYDVQLTPSGGMPRTYLRGRITLASDVTRD